MIQPSVTIPVDPEAIHYLKPGESRVIASSEPMTVYVVHGGTASVYPCPNDEIEIVMPGGDDR